MIKICYTLLALYTLAAVSCNTHQAKAPETDTDIATAFIRNILDNNLQEAEKFILKDETNLQYFEIIKQQYRRKDKAELERYKNADIIINEVSAVTDTVTVINYSNSYSKESKNKVKVIRVDNKWQVDLKYTFSGNM